MSRIFIAAVLATLASWPAEAATQTIELHGVVPVICRADFQSDPTIGGDGTMHLGTLNEFCNAGSGYEILVDYDGSADPGSLLIDGQAVALNASGHSVLVSMNGPRAITQSLSYIPGSRPITSVHILIQSSLI